MKKLNLFVILLLIIFSNLEITAQENKSSEIKQSPFSQRKNLGEMPREKEELLLRLHSSQERNKLSELKKLSKVKYFQILWDLPIYVPPAEKKNSRLLNDIVVFGEHVPNEVAQNSMLELDVEILALRFQKSDASVKNKIRFELAQKLDELFDSSVEAKQKRIDDLNTRIKILSEDLGLILRNKDKIVNNRLSELLGKQ